MNTINVRRSLLDNPSRLVSRLVLDHRQELLRYAERLLDDCHIAEDIVQEVLIRAWQHTEQLQHSSQSSVRSWLFKVTRNLVIDRSRTAVFRREIVGTEDHDPVRPDYAEAVLSSMETTALLRRLSHEHREVLMHRYICGRTLEETAEMLGIPLGTAKSRYHYALSYLRKDVQKTAAAKEGTCPGRGSGAPTSAGPSEAENLDLLVSRCSATEPGKHTSVTEGASSTGPWCDRHSPAAPTAEFTYHEEI